MIANDEVPGRVYLLPWGLAGLAALVAPWLLGGRAAIAHPLLGSLCWLAAAAAVAAVWADHRGWRHLAEFEARRGGGREDPLRVLGRGLLRTLPLWLFIGLLAAGAANPAYLREGGRLVLQEHNAALPLVVDPARSRPGIYFLCGLVALTALLLNPAVRARRRWMRALLAVLLLNAVALACTGFWFRFAGNGLVLGEFKPRAGYFFASFYYKNHWAAYAILYCGVAAAFFFRDLPRWFSHARQAGSGALALVALLVLGLTLPVAESRSGILLFALLVLAVAAGVFRQLRARAARLALAGAIALALGGFLALTTAELRDEWRRTGQQVDKAGSLVFDHVRAIHGPQVCLALLRDRPLWGWGYLSYAPLFPVYATDFFRNEQGRLTTDMEFAHSDWLQHAAEFGLAGTALLAAGLILAFTSKSKSKSKPKPAAAERRWILLGAALVGLLALWDFPFSNPAVLVSLACLVPVSRAT